MKALLLTAIACSLHGQITVTETRTPSGTLIFKVKITSDVALTAAAVSYRIEGRDSPEFWYLDELTDEAAPKREFEIGPRQIIPRGGKAPVLTVSQQPVTAAIFHDGTTTGAPDLIRRLVWRRCNLLQAVELSLETISEAGRHNVSRTRMIAEFKRLSTSARRWYLPPEQQMSAGVYQTIVGKLINLPEPPLGSAFPPAEFVEQETERLNRQRTVLLESKPNLLEGGHYVR